ncbi:MAG: phosphoribosylglycinamide formyltransferase [candidate division Zixibacteria bacterium]|nr:phosphoribosylglycinamide formyltransferase [candidate division Zixibacteria bacterium]
MDCRAKIAVFISGGGSNLQSLMDASEAGRLSGEIVLVISGHDNAYGLERAFNAGIDTFVYKVSNYPSKEDARRDLLEMLKEYEVEFIALAGYLKLLPSTVVKYFKNRITNIHPALLPKYGGKGMYGRHVHDKIIKSGDKESGVTVHLVDDIYDHGKIIMQKKVAISAQDTPKSLAAKVLKMEHRIYPDALNKLICETKKI